MGRGKNPAPKPKPKPGKADRKVIIEYSSDEEFDEDNPQPVVGTGVPKRVVKQIHLTLLTSPSHVTTTESFKTFFINRSLMRALQKAFQKRRWSTDQMQELMTNFKDKHRQMIPLPKIYQDEDTSDSEGLELADATKVGRKAAGGSGGSKPGGSGGGTSKPSGSGGAVGSAGGSAGSSGGAEGSGGGDTGPGGSAGGSAGAGGSGGGAGSGGPGKGSKCGRDEDDDPDDDPNKRRKTDPAPKHPIARREPRQGQPTYGGQYLGPGLRQGVVYPPIDRNLAPLYISQIKKRTKLSYRTIPWIKSQLQKIHQAAQIQGRNNGTS